MFPLRLYKNSCLSSVLTNKSYHNMKVNSILVRLWQKSVVYVVLRKRKLGLSQNELNIGNGKEKLLAVIS